MFNWGTWKNQESVNEHKPVNDETSSGGAIPIPLNSIDEALKSFCLAFKFTEIWLKSFKMNYKNRTSMFCKEIIELFKKIPDALPKPVDYMKKRKTLLTYIGGK